MQDEAEHLLARASNRNLAFCLKNNTKIINKETKMLVPIATNSFKYITGKRYWEEMLAIALS